jgi:hypothetical protein
VRRSAVKRETNRISPAALFSKSGKIKMMAMSAASVKRSRLWCAELRSTCRICHPSGRAVFF